MLTLSTRHVVLHLEHSQMQNRDQMPTKYWNNTVLRNLPAAVLPEYTQTFIYIATKCTLSQMHTFSNTHRYLLRVHPAVLDPVTLDSSQFLTASAGNNP